MARPSSSSNRMSVDGVRAPATSTPATKKRKIDWANIDDTGFDGFSIEVVKPGSAAKALAGNGQPSKKRKLYLGQEQTSDWSAGNLGAEIHQPNPFTEAKLSDLRVRVREAEQWESTVRYRRFTVDGSEFCTGDTIFVNAEQSQQIPHAQVKAWVAKILEVRGGSADHVYLRVYWMYRPEDLPGGRQSYHGTNELIASNDMAIIDAMSVQERVDVHFWDESNDDGTLDLQELYWRQSYDVTLPKRTALSRLPTHCIDKVPHNPDCLLLYCDSCSNWLHGPCLEAKAVRTAYENHAMAPPDEKATLANRKPKKRPFRKAAQTPKPAFSAFTATLRNDAGKTRVTVTDHRPDQSGTNWDVPVQCLLCKAAITDEDPTEESKQLMGLAATDRRDTTSPNSSPKSSKSASSSEGESKHNNAAQNKKHDTASLDSSPKSSNSASSSSEDESKDDDDDDDIANQTKNTQRVDVYSLDHHLLLDDDIPPTNTNNPKLKAVAAKASPEKAPTPQKSGARRLLEAFTRTPKK